MRGPGRPPFDGSPMPELISVTSETVDATFPELPAWSGWRWVSVHSCNMARST